MTVTMREVAEAAGVSTSTVSRVLNDKRSIQLTDECRRRVQQAARLLDRRLRGEDGPWQRITLAPTLKVRESSGPGPHNHSS